MVNIVASLWPSLSFIILLPPRGIVTQVERPCCVSWGKGLRSEAGLRSRRENEGARERERVCVYEVAIPRVRERAKGYRNSRKG
jgi:hypothetical protein